MSQGLPRLRLEGRSAPVRGREAAAVPERDRERALGQHPLDLFQQSLGGCHARPETSGSVSFMARRAAVLAALMMLAAVPGASIGAEADTASKESRIAKSVRLKSFGSCAALVRYG